METTFAPVRSLGTAPSQSSLKFERAGATFIYALRDPRTSEIRYIGKADNPEERLRMHMWGIKWEKSHKASWIRSLVKIGLRPSLEIIDEVAQTEWQAAEAAYIMFYKESGCPLVNATPGGEGTGAGEAHPRYGGRHSIEARSKMSHAWKYRQPLSAEVRARIATSHKGLKHSEQARAKLSASKQGARNPNFGKHPSAETLAKRSAALKGKIKSAEWCAKLGAAHRGKKASPETRAKMSASAKLRCKRQRERWQLEFWK